VRTLTGLQYNSVVALNKKPPTCGTPDCIKLSKAIFIKLSIHYNIVEWFKPLYRVVPGAMDKTSGECSLC